MRRTAILLSALAMWSCGGGGGNGGDGGGGSNPIVASDVFDESQLSDVELTMDPADWQSILDDSMGDTYRTAQFKWRGETLDQVGVRPGGDTDARMPGNQKQSMRVKFDAIVPGQRFHGLAELELDGMSNDFSMMRERLAYALYRGRIAAPRVAHARVLVNGELRGLYQMEEVVDSVMVQSRFGGVGNTYQVQADPTDQYAWKGEDVNQYVPYPWLPITNEAGPHADLVDMLNALSNDPTRIEAVLDMESILTYFAIETIINNTDGFASDFGPNMHYSADRADNGKFAIIPWDTNSTWWAATADRSIYQNFQNSKLTQLLELDPTFRQRYKDRIAQILAAEGGATAIAAKVDSIYAQIQPAAHEDPFKPYSNQDVDDSRDVIKQFATDREANIQMQLQLP